MTHATTTPVATPFDYAGLDPEVRAAVKALASEIHWLVRDAAVQICEIGNALIAAKERLDHGQFSDWLAAEFAWSHATATRMMAVARRFDPETLHGANFHASALYLLAGGEIPEEARQEALQQAQAGETMTRAKVQAIAAGHYVPVRSLEQGLRTWLAGLDLPGEDPRETAWQVLGHLKEAKKASAYWEDLVEALPVPHRQRDVVQAVNNLYEQERVKRWQASPKGQEQKRQAALVRAKEILVKVCRLDQWSNLGRLRLEKLVQASGEDDPLTVWSLMHYDIEALGLTREDLEAIARDLLEELDQEQEDPAFDLILSAIRSWLATVPIRQRLFALQDLTQHRSKSQYYAKALAHVPEPEGDLDKALFFRVAAMVRDNVDLREGLEPLPEDLDPGPHHWGDPTAGQDTQAGQEQEPVLILTKEGLWAQSAVVRGAVLTVSGGKDPDHRVHRIQDPADVQALTTALDGLDLVILAPDDTLHGLAASLCRYVDDRDIIDPDEPQYKVGLALHLPGARLELYTDFVLGWRLVQEETNVHSPSP